MIYRIRFQLVAMMVVVVLVATGTMTALTWVASQNAFAHFITVNDGVQVARLEQSVGRLIEETENLQAAQPFVDEISSMAGAEIVVMDGVSGETLIQSRVGTEALPVTDFVWTDVQIDETIEVVGVGEFRNYTVQVNPSMTAAYQPGHITLTTPYQSYTQRIRASLILASLLSGGVAVGLALALSAAIANPLQNLTRAANQLQQGNLNPHITTGGHGEIGELTNAFAQMAASLRRNEQLRRNMVSDVAHELRTPVTNIQGYIEAMQDGLIPLRPPQLASLHEEVLLIGHLLKDLQQLAVAEAGQLDLAVQPVHLADVVAQVVALWSLRANERDVQIRADLPPSLSPIEADRSRLVQMLQNLLSNAVRHSPAGGCVRIEVCQYATHLALAVVDSGPGIPAEDVPYIFERFYRVDPSRNRGTGGTGLGLAITRQLAQAHGWRISVISQPHQRTAFTIDMPR